MHRAKLTEVLQRECLDRPFNDTGLEESSLVCSRAGKRIANPGTSALRTGAGEPPANLPVPPLRCGRGRCCQPQRINPAPYTPEAPKLLWPGDLLARSGRTQRRKQQPCGTREFVSNSIFSPFTLQPLRWKEGRYPAPNAATLLGQAELQTPGAKPGSTLYLRGNSRKDPRLRKGQRESCLSALRAAGLHKYQASSGHLFPHHLTEAMPLLSTGGLNLSHGLFESGKFPVWESKQLWGLPFLIQPAPDNQSLNHATDVVLTCHL